VVTQSYVAGVASSTGIAGMVTCLGAGYFKLVTLERVGMWMCVIAACEFLASFVIGMMN
jgi:hypothetical protein